ncbi:MAG: RNA polymerase sigma factor [Planctomycetota bacterium]
MSAEAREAAEAAFVRYCVDGDANSLAIAFHGLTPQLASQAGRIASDAASAEDLVQATFLVAIESRTRFDPSRSPSAWLSGILRHLGERQARRRRRWSSPADLREDSKDGEFDEPLDRILVDRDTPGLIAERAEFAQSVREGIARLPATYRSVLEEVLLQGRTADELASTWNRPSPTVRSQLRRGLEKLRRTLPAAWSAMVRAAQFLRGVLLSRAGLAVVALGAAIAVWRAVATSSGGDSPPLASGHHSTLRTSLPTETDDSNGRMSPKAASLARVPRDERATMPRTVVTVRRALDSEPIVHVDLDFEDEGGRRFVVRSDGEGHVVLDDVLVSAVLRVPFARAEIVIARANPSTNVVIDLLVPPGVRVRGRLLDAKRAPIADGELGVEVDGRFFAIARSGSDGIASAVDLAPAVRHRLRARHGSLVSPIVEGLGASGEIVEYDFQLDSDSGPVEPSSPVAVPGPSPIESLPAPRAAICDFDLHFDTDRRVDGFDACLLPPCGDEPMAHAVVYGRVARFQGVPLSAARCVLIARPKNGGPAAAAKRVLTNRATSVARLVEVDGGVKSVRFEEFEIPSCALAVVAVNPLAELDGDSGVVALDFLGRPSGMLYLGSPRIDRWSLGPFREGPFVFAVTRAKSVVRYFGPFTLSRSEPTWIELGPPDAIARLYLRSADAGEFDFQLCVGEALILPPVATPDGALQLAPGRYTLFWRQGVRRSGRVDLDLGIGRHDVLLESSPRRATVFEFRYDEECRPADGLAAVDWIVRGADGRTLWRERSLGPLEETGRLRVVRGLGDGAPSANGDEVIASVLADDRRGPRGHWRMEGDVGTPAPGRRVIAIELR